MNNCFYVNFKPLVILKYFTKLKKNKVLKKATMNFDL